MLGRTAATLESCASSHALPSASRSLKSRRQLHTGFWQHGAASIDINSPVQSLFVNNTEPAASDPPPSAQSTSTESLAASTFLLELLYPTGAAALVRRLSPGLRDRQASSIQRLPRRSRLFTSSATVAAEADSQEDPLERHVQANKVQSEKAGKRIKAKNLRKSMLQAELEDKDREQQEPGNSEEGIFDNNSTKPKALRSSTLEADLERIVREQQESGDSQEATFKENADPPASEASSWFITEADARNTTRTHSGPSFAGAGSRPDLMRNLMANRHTEYFGSIWQLFAQLESHLMPEFRPEVIKYLYRSSALLDSRRILLLSAELRSDQWDSAVLTAVINANLRFGNESEAMKLFIDGLHKEGCTNTTVGGLDDMLEYSFSKGKWEMIKQVVLEYHQVFMAHTINGEALDRLAQVPNLGSAVLRFEKEIQSEESCKRKQLRSVLKKVAIRALLQPCNPEEALPLLRIINQPKFYCIYLDRAIRRGQRECLPDVYRSYRAFPDTKPHWVILHGMFEIFYPDDIRGLEEVYEDYHVSYQGLDKWGYQKFLKFYASRGDVKSLRRLWDKYIETYKHRDVLKDPATFNQILNAYANIGDAQGARRVFDEMRSKYGVTPNLVSWNTLLKCQASCHSYDDTLAVFDELCDAVTPDEYSFATVMSMTGSSGDVTKTLYLFQKAAQFNVQLNVHIWSAIIHALCRQKQWADALAACVKAKNQGIPGEHADLWNILLHHHSERRAFGEVCRIVGIMAKVQINWTSDTHNVLLRALVRCRQVHSAYRTLRTAVRDTSFKVTSEHFTTVMDGGLRTHELAIVGATDKLRRTSGSPRTIDSMILKIDAMIRQQTYSTRSVQPENDFRELLASYIQEMLDSITAGTTVADGDHQASLQSLIRSADSLYRLGRLLRKAISIFSKSGDFELVKEMQRLQTDLELQAPSDPDGVSFDVLCALLKENVQEKKYDEAKANWAVIWERAVEKGHPDKYQGDRAMPRYAYMLSSAIKAIRRVYVEQKDAAGFKAIVDRALKAGFRFNRITMNYVCQSLADAGDWLAACELCEEHLMPSFTGWQVRRMEVEEGLMPSDREKRLEAPYRQRTPLDLRRLGNAPQWLRASSFTIVILARDYMKTKSVALWSPADSEKIQIIKDRCPRLLNAWDSIEYSGVGIEAVVFANSTIDRISGKRYTKEGREIRRKARQTKAAHIEGVAGAVAAVKGPNKEGSRGRKKWVWQLGTVGLGGGKRKVWRLTPSARRMRWEWQLSPVVLEGGKKKVWRLPQSAAGLGGGGKKLWWLGLGLGGGEKKISRLGTLGRRTRRKKLWRLTPAKAPNKKTVAEKKLWRPTPVKGPNKETVAEKKLWRLTPVKGPNKETGAEKKSAR